MKTRPSCIAWLTSVLAISLFTSGCAGIVPTSVQAYAHPVNYVEHGLGAIIGQGTSRAEVLDILGAPRRRLGDNVWIYRNFDAGLDQSAADDCHTLAVSFSDDRVSGLKLINDRTEIILADHLPPRANEPVQIAAK